MTKPTENNIELWAIEESQMKSLPTIHLSPRFPYFNLQPSKYFIPLSIIPNSIK